MARTTARGEVYADLTDPVAQFAHGQLQDWHDVLSQHDGVGNTDREILLHMKRKDLVLRHIQVTLEHWQGAEFASNRHVETAWRPVHDRMVAAAGRQGGDASMARQWERGWTQEQVNPPKSGECNMHHNLLRLSIGGSTLLCAVSFPPPDRQMASHSCCPPLLVPSYMVLEMGLPIAIPWYLRTLRRRNLRWTPAHLRPCHRLPGHEPRHGIDEHTSVWIHRTIHLMTRKRNGSEAMCGGSSIQDEAISIWFFWRVLRDSDSSWDEALVASLCRSFLLRGFNFLEAVLCLTSGFWVAFGLLWLIN